MNLQDLRIDREQLRRLLAAKSPEGALLYLYLSAGNDPATACDQLGLTEQGYSCALALLRQLGLYEDRRSSFVPGERPGYTEEDVTDALARDDEFGKLYAEVQRLLGKTLNTEELKILLGFIRYLGLPGEVITVLISWCRERNRSRGSSRNPSLRTIEKEAYFWAEQGIDTLEEAAAFIRSRNLQENRLSRLKKLLQLGGRQLTPGESRYAEAWLAMGMDDNVLAEAYDRTCVNTGGFNWAYMNRILTRWHQAGFRTLEAVKRGDRKDVPKGASGQLGAAELEALQRMLQEDAQ